MSNNVENQKPNTNVYSLQKRKKNRRKRRIFKTAVVVLIIVAVIMLLRIIPLFNINNITVTGNRHYTDKQIIKTLNIPKNQNAFKQFGLNIFNMLTFRYRDLEGKLKKEYPYIYKVKVRYRLFDNVKVEIVEKNVVGAFKKDNKYVVIDRNGKLVEVADSAPENTPVVFQMKFNYKPEIFSNVEFDDEYIFDGLVTLKDTIRAHDRESKYKVYKKISRIYAPSASNYRIVLNNTILVKIGSLDNLDYKISLMKEIVEGQIKYTEKGVLDLTAKDPVFKVNY